MPIMKLKTLALALALTCGAVVAVSLPSAVLAQSQASKQAVDAAKAAGKVGEQGDGFLGIIADADSALRAAVAEINAGRKQVYADTAAKTGVTVEAAGEATARQLIARAPAGQMVKPLGGTWMRK
jgi:uncharacterized protein YdbL (DUF1318 family)